jgi:hypothetical protein
LTVLQQAYIMKREGVEIISSTISNPSPSLLCPKPRMTEADEIEAARKLFAGPCDFVWGSTSAENLPPQNLNEVAFVGRSNAGKVQPGQCADGAQKPGAGLPDAGATRQINFFNLAAADAGGLPGYGFAKRSRPKPTAGRR